MTPKLWHVNKRHRINAACLHMCVVHICCYMKHPCCNNTPTTLHGIACRSTKKLETTCTLLESIETNIKLKPFWPYLASAGTSRHTHVPLPWTPKILAWRLQGNSATTKLRELKMLPMPLRNLANASRHPAAVWQHRICHKIVSTHMGNMTGLLFSHHGHWSWDHMGTPMQFLPILSLTAPSGVKKTWHLQIWSDLDCQWPWGMLNSISHNRWVSGHFWC